MITLFNDYLIWVTQFQVESTHKQTDDVIAILSHRSLTHWLKHNDLLEDWVSLEYLREQVELNFKFKPWADHC